MRVCTPSCGMAPNSNSGGEVVERELALAWARAGLPQCILIADHLKVPWNLEPVERFKARGIRWWNAPLAFVPAILRCHRRHGFQVLRAHSLRYTGLACLIASRITKTPVVATFHHREVVGRDALERFVLRHVDKVVTASVFSAWQLHLDYGIPPTDSVVVPWGIDASHFVPHKPDPHWWWDRYSIGNSPVVLACGGLKPRKGFDRLLQAWGEVCRYHPTAVLAIAGEGPEFSRLVEMAYHLGILKQRVRFLGRVSDEQKVELYQHADVYTILPTMEGFGMTPIEAMAAGCPVVTTSTGVAASELRDPGAVLEVVQRGYRLGDRVVRPARVIVAAGEE